MRTIGGMACGYVIMSVIPYVAFAAQEPQLPAQGRLNIVVVEGEGAINNIKQRTARETIVQVEDENHKPVAGAAVAFLLPGDGPSGAFAGGSRVVTVTTDVSGRVAMPRLQPNQLTGRFQIHVTASAHGQQASTTISQSNATSAAASSSSSAAHGALSGKTIGILVGIAAAGAVGAAVGLHGGNGSTPPTPPVAPAGTISFGTGTAFGPSR